MRFRSFYLISWFMLGNSAVPKAIPAPMQITQAQWNELTAQQQQVYRQQHMFRMQQQQARQAQAQQQHQAGAPQQQAGAAAAAAAGAQAQRRPTSISQGISFGALMPLLQPHLPPEQSERLSALYQRFKASSGCSPWDPLWEKLPTARISLSFTPQIPRISYVGDHDGMRCVLKCKIFHICRFGF